MTQFRRTVLGVLLAAVIFLTGYTIFLMSRVRTCEAEDGNVTVIENIEQTEAMEHPDFIREVYLPVIPEGTNIALDAKMQANEFQDVYTARKAADGKTNGMSYWEGRGDAYPNILTASFEEPQSIHAVRVCLCPLPVWSKRTQSFAVEVSGDGENFTVLQEEEAYLFDPDTGNEVVLAFEDVEVKAVRLVFSANSGASGAQVAEFEVYSR